MRVALVLLIVSALGLRMSSARAQSDNPYPDVRLLVGPSYHTSGETALHSQLRVEIPFPLMPRVEALMQWREHATQRSEECPLIGDCSVDLLHHGDAFGIGLAVTFEVLGARSTGGHSFYVGGYWARQWQYRDEWDGSPASGFIVGTEVLATESIALGLEAQLGFSQELEARSSRIHLTPAFQVIVGR